MNVLVLNGPNLDLLGSREPEIYGSATLAELEHACRRWGAERGMSVTTLQSNHEGALIDALHDSIGNHDGVVLNAGALSHYSYALHDAITGIPVPVVEVHISDVQKREPWRHTSVIAAACVASISGRGMDGYRDALDVLLDV